MDSVRFLKIAENFYYSNFIDYEQILSSGTFVFSYYGSLVFQLFGISPVMLGFLSVIYGTITVYYIYKASLLLWENEKNAIRVAWFAALFPQLCLNSALFLREPIISMFTVISAYHLIQFWKYQKTSGIIIFVMLTLINTLLHTGSLFALVGLIAAIVLIPQQSRSKNKAFLSKLIALGLIGGSIMYVLTTGYGLEKVDQETEDLFADVTAIQISGTRGGAMYPSWMQLQGGASDIVKLPFRFAAFLFAPLLPPMARSGGHILGVFDGLLYLLLAIGIYKLRKQSIFSNKTAIVVLFVLIGLVFVYSMGVSNFGTGIRHRGKIAPLLLILYFHPKIYKELLRNQWANLNLRSKNQDIVKTP
ncbi:MAG: hypothetical protein ACK4UK_03485 [Flavobacterium sp.]